jgi:hypothetical protein
MSQTETHKGYVTAAQHVGKKTHELNLFYHRVSASSSIPFVDLVTGPVLHGGPHRSLIWFA